MKRDSFQPVDWLVGRAQIPLFRRTQQHLLDDPNRNRDRRDFDVELVEVIGMAIIECVVVRLGYRHMMPPAW